MVGYPLKNAVRIVEKMPEHRRQRRSVFKSALWTALRTIFRPNLHLIAFTVVKIFSGGDTPRTSAEASPVLGPRHKFPLGSPAFPLYPVDETTTDGHSPQTSNPGPDQDPVKLRFR